MVQLKDYKVLKTQVQGSRPNEPLNELQIEVNYQLGGWNHFNGDLEERGVYLSLHPVRRGNGFIQTIIDGQLHTMGYKILLKELGRKSQKQLDLAAEKLMPFAGEIADLYSEGKHNEIVQLVKKVYNNE
jgi:hypothetical protein